jgi:hypothetical protein
MLKFAAAAAHFAVAVAVLGSAGVVQQPQRGAVPSLPVPKCKLSQCCQYQSNNVLNSTFVYYHTCGVPFT